MDILAQDAIHWYRDLMDNKSGKNLKIDQNG